MIQIPTVLILGAGASAFLGYPLGNELKRSTVSSLSNPESQDYKNLRTLGFSEERIENFTSELAFSGKQSIDAFLEHRYEFADVGKAAVAQALMRHEDFMALFHSDDNWYEYLYAKMNAPFDALDENRLAIVTFNYDRSLEAYLFSALKNSYGKSEQAVAEKLSAIPIVHVHGQLGQLPWIPKYGRAYHPDISPIHIAQAALGIRIVHEGQPIHPLFLRAQQLIHDARRVVFLGFAYDTTNVSRLSLDPARETTTYYGTSYGLTPLEIDQVGRSFLPRGIIQGNNQMKVLEFLRSTIEW